MSDSVLRWLAANRAILANASTLVGTTAMTSGLGFVYWWLAAHLFPPTAVGFAAAAISAMTLLGTVGMLGLGTLLISELPRQPGRELALITTALIVPAGVGTGLGVLLALGAPILFAELRPLAGSVTSVALFAVGVGLTAVTLVLDQALIGLLRGGLQLWRNVLFATAKLGALQIVGLWLADQLGLAIYATWVLGNLVSLVVLWQLGRSQGGWQASRPQWALLHGLKRVALGHHALNLALLAPSLVLPVLVTALLSAAVNASFFIAWMVANFAFVGPAALATMLYAVGAASPAVLAHKARLTLKLSALIGLAANLVLLLSADLVLHIFGSDYAAQAAGSLRVLGFAVFPVIIKDHYVAICRVYGRISRATLVVAVGDCCELVAAAIGASVGGLLGLSLGWLAVSWVEGFFMARTVYMVAAVSEPADEHLTSRLGPPLAILDASTQHVHQVNREQNLASHLVQGEGSQG